MRRVLSVSSKLLLAIVAFSAWMVAGAPPSRIFTVDDDLAGNRVRRIRLDRNGLLWICTTEGLSIYDGRAFTSFTGRDGLPGRTTSDVLHDSSGTYWIGTGGGLAKFHPRTEHSGVRFERMEGSGFDSLGSINVLAEDDQKVLWIGTRTGLYRLFPGKTSRPEYVALSSNPKNIIWDLKTDSFGRIWAATEEGLYTRYKTGRVERVGERNGIGVVRTLLLDSRCRLWAGGAGLFELNPSSNFPAVTRVWTKEHPTFINVRSLHEDSSHQLWVGAFGLIKFQPEAERRSRVAVVKGLSALGEHYVHALNSDIDGNLWMGLGAVGLSRVSREPSNLYTIRDGLGSPYTAGVFEDRRGRLQVLTDTARTISEFRKGIFIARPLRAALPAGNWGWGTGQVMLQDRTGEWWAVSASGVLRFTATDDLDRLATSKPVRYTERDGLISRLVLSIFEDSRGCIWEGGGGGFASFSHATGKWTSYKSPEDYYAFTQMFAEDRSGNVWAALTEGTLMRVHNGKAEVVLASDHLKSINALLVDRQGQLWIGSSAGLRLIRNPAADRPTIENAPFAGALRSDNTFALADDEYGRLYVSGARGIDRIDLRSMTAKRFTSTSGSPIGDTEWLYRDHEGCIWFCSTRGLARYCPEPDRTHSLPSPMLKSLMAGGSFLPVSVLGESAITGIRLAPSQDHLVVGFRAPNFDPAEQVRYQYRMDRQWSSTTDLEAVHFTGLAPGRHKFEVRSVGADGRTSSSAHLDFYLEPPVWQRWWFLLTAIAAAGVLLYNLHVYRLNQMLEVERIRRRIATDLHDDLGAGLAEIAILSEVAKRKPGENGVLDSVAQRARGLRLALEDIVWSIDPRKDRLSDLVRRIRDMAVRVLESEACRVEFSAPPEESLERIEIGPDLRRHLLLICQEVITNIARHASATVVDIEFALRGSAFVLAFADNGRGFPVEGRCRAGNGLSNIRYRSDEIDGQLQVISQPGAGCRLELVIPALRK